MSDAEVLTIVGKNDGIKEKQQGWFEVEVSVPGKQYPVRLATKRTALIDGLRATIGQVATFTYTEKDSNRTNPNSGNPYKNRYLESVEAGGVAQAPTAGGSSGGGGGDADRMSKEDWNAKDRRDFRSRAWAQTISAFAHTVKTEEDAVAVFQRLKPFQEMIYKDIVRELGDGPPATQPVQQQLVAEADEHAGYESGDHPDDDDIPF